ncbi:hypothetical protein LY76DRAFT_525971 [Colletotrichum caudatum]|nr:hypothetical protein LY76DRAFT_525971 [Colletotrichum caudatum]
MSTINPVKYCFHRANVPSSEARIRQLVTMANQTARDKEFILEQYLSGTKVYFTTTINSRRQKEPLRSLCDL